MDNILKDVFFRLGVYEYAKRYLVKPYKKIYGITFRFSSKAAIKTLIETMNQNKYQYWLEFGTFARSC